MEVTPPLKSPQNEPAGPANGSGIDLFVTVRDKDGRIVSELCKEGDLYLYNFVVIIAGILKSALCHSPVKPYYVIGRDGVQIQASTPVFCSQTQYTNGSSSHYLIQNWANQGKIVVGSASTPPQTWDFDLGLPIKEIPGLLPTIETSGNTLRVCMAGTALFDVETVLCETGLSLTPPWWCPNQTAQPAPTPVLITRDTFPAQTVPAGGTATIRFELWFNAMPPTT